eukprot:scaffold251026_cov30-Tisochrysis_lutea.AAC.1
MSRFLPPSPHTTNCACHSPALAGETPTKREARIAREREDDSVGRRPASVLSFCFWGSQYAIALSLEKIQE